MGLAIGEALLRGPTDVGISYQGRGEAPPSHRLFSGSPDRSAVRYRRGLRRPDDRSEVLLLAVPDDEVAGVAAAIAEHGPPEGVMHAFHLSGALDADALAPLSDAGYRVGTLHPLQSVSGPEMGADRLRGSYFGISGEEGTRALGARLVRMLGGEPLEVPAGNRPLYHAAATLVSNSIPALLAVGSEWMVRAGVPTEHATAALLPLLRGTVENLGSSLPRRALTGPVSRGDVETVRMHMEALDGPGRALYRELAWAVLRLAADRLPGEVEREMERTLEEENR